MKQEKSIKLYNSLTNVNETYIEEAQATKNIQRKKYWNKWLPMAACLILVAALGFGAMRNGWFGIGNDIATLNNGETITFVKQTTLTTSNIDLDINIRDLTDTELDSLFADLPVTGLGCFDVNDHRLIGFEGQIDDMKLIISAPNVTIRDTIVEGIEKTSTVKDIPVTAGYFVTQANSKGERTAIYYADFKLGDYAVYLENAGPKSQSENIKNELADAILKLIEHGALDFNQISE